VRVRPAAGKGEASNVTKLTIQMGTAPAEVVVSVNNTQESLWLSSLANMNIDVIELASGDYSWGNGIVSPDRTSRPLTIRPALGATVNFTRPAAGSAMFAIGYGGACKYVTFDGRPGGLGTASGMYFKDTVLAKDGIFEVYTSSFFTVKYCTFQNNAPGTYGGQTGGPTTTWCFYIGIGGSVVDDMTIDHCWFKSPATARTMGVAQVYDNGSAAVANRLRITNVQELDAYSVGFTAYGNVVNDIVLDTWTMSNVYGYFDAHSIYFYGAAFQSGAYSNITATNCATLGDTHSGGGTVTNGGGNSGI